MGAALVDRRRIMEKRRVAFVKRLWRGLVFAKETCLGRVLAQRVREISEKSWRRREEGGGIEKGKWSLSKGCKEGQELGKGDRKRDEG